jgi:UDP-3-O-[3-hydroxymyristoyl] N-acetylglucosamine deacetylase/3-hydroxyacyl-[acyl-carrier-protein] dehydratase
VGIKNVTFNEPFFQGHFPNEPVMPGVLLVETMAQVGGMLVLGDVDDAEKWSTYFLKMDKVKIRQKVIPGDTLVIKCSMPEPPRRGIVQMYCHVYIGDKVVAEGDFTALIEKKE